MTEKKETAKRGTMLLTLIVASDSGWFGRCEIRNN